MLLQLVASLVRRAWRAHSICTYIYDAYTRKPHGPYRPSRLPGPRPHAVDATMTRLNRAQILNSSGQQNGGAPAAKGVGVGSAAGFDVLSSSGEEEMKK